MPGAIPLIAAGTPDDLCAYGKPLAALGGLAA